MPNQVLNPHSDAVSNEQERFFVRRRACQRGLAARISEITEKDYGAHSGRRPYRNLPPCFRDAHDTRPHTVVYENLLKEIRFVREHSPDVQVGEAGGSLTPGIVLRR